ncbi:protein of unknown function [Pseudomonas inefficax]|uniref:Uncharacterized protein n=1 Tax=Pseudomonas inefficax TaxID=2078786 RepID=A0AAQ1P4N6_9PSED|nr:protein of unknown function [Pseudomonas inefficax]
MTLNLPFTAPCMIDSSPRAIKKPELAEIQI